ncbi:(2Fe-2S)-binding protein [Saccharibacillus sp. JS10]|uniref:(2Fe-2S)-binding protein n=1 Tax=Saccharibacillus sp. JS10 TaxID=2950552 RepID=UPI00210BD09F|nr:(2Fe-2S)-binding protein [Saccharibacillus sp. JS10]MCQ4085398.1 (2Fe-2S)-binding protein [Saccharibacillus sp. JS10]
MPDKILFDKEWIQPQFYMATERNPEAVATATLEELSTPEGAKSFLHTFAQLLQAPDLQAAVTYFCSWFSGAVTASLYFPVVKGIRPDFSASNLSAQLFRYDNGGHSMQIVIDSRLAEPAPQKESPARWTEEGFRLFYGETCRPLFENFAALSGVPVGMIWAQLPGRLDYFAQTWRTHPDLSVELAPYVEQLEKSYAQIKNLEPQLFGRKKNPFDLRFRYIEHMTDPTQQIQMRPSCCLYHMLPGAEACYNCPKLSEQDRVERREKARAQ